MPTSRSQRSAESTARHLKKDRPHTASEQRTEEERKRLNQERQERETVRTQRSLRKAMQGRAPSKRS